MTHLLSNPMVKTTRGGYFCKALYVCLDTLDVAVLCCPCSINCTFKDVSCFINAECVTVCKIHLIDCTNNPLFSCGPRCLQLQNKHFTVSRGFNTSTSRNYQMKTTPYHIDIITYHQRPFKGESGIST